MSKDDNIKLDLDALIPNIIHDKEPPDEYKEAISIARKKIAKEYNNLHYTEWRKGFNKDTDSNNILVVRGINEDGSLTEDIFPSIQKTKDEAWELQESDGFRFMLSYMKSTNEDLEGAYYFVQNIYLH